MNKIRVLHCLETIGSGGVEQLRLILARSLDKEKYQQAIVCTQTGGIIASQLEDAGCKVYTVGLLRHPFDKKTHKNVLQAIKEFNPHIIHGAVFEGVTMASICGALSRVPIIIGEETSDPQNRSWRGNLLLKVLSFLTHKMVGVSPASYNYLTEKINISKHKAVLINNGVEIYEVSSQKVKSNLRQNLKIDDNCFVIGFVGRLLDEHKRVSDLIKAFAEVIKKYPVAKLLIVGDGPDKEMLEKLANDLGVSGNVIFSGYQPETKPFYDVMNVFVLPSAFEAFGLVLVEAMAAELPVVASRVGGIPYVVDEENTGLLFESKNINELVEKLSYIIEMPLVARDMGIKGRARAIENFSSERYVNDVDKLYEQLIISRRVMV